MNTNQLVQILRDNIPSCDNSYIKVFLNKNPEIKQDLQKILDAVPQYQTLHILVKCLYQDIKLQKCINPNCNNYVNYVSSRNGYKACSRRCGSAARDVLEKVPVEHKPRVTKSSYKRVDKDKSTANKYKEYVTIVDGKWKCNVCGNIFDKTDKFPRCLVCYPYKDNSSLHKQQILDYIKQFVSQAHLDGDIFKLPDLPYIIQFDGLLSNCLKNNPDKNYFLNNTKKYQQDGYRLIHIYEDEWINKSDIIKGRLKHILEIEKNTQKIYARKCEVKEIDNDIKRDFLISYHLQGNDSSAVKLGLYYEQQLVAVMTFGHPRFSKKYQWELIRYAVKFDCSVIGGAGKLLKYFERNYNPDNITTYADIRWSQGNLYNQIGFTHLHNSYPNYFYIDQSNPIERFTRIQYQKHKLQKKLKVYDPQKTEVQNMNANNFYQIFDCGNMVFEKVYNKDE